jgi:hypothetical protein
VLLDFLCRVQSGELCAGGDAADAAWAAKNDLAKYRLEQLALDVIAKAFATSSSQIPKRSEGSL